MNSLLHNNYSKSNFYCCIVESFFFYSFFFVLPRNLLSSWKLFKNLLYYYEDLCPSLYLPLDFYWMIWFSASQRKLNLCVINFFTSYSALLKTYLYLKSFLPSCVFGFFLFINSFTSVFKHTCGRQYWLVMKSHFHPYLPLLPWNTRKSESFSTSHIGKSSQPYDLILTNEIWRIL